MSIIVDLEKLFHRSKERIKILGEVFTPEVYVEDMLRHLSKDRRTFWADEELVFFEPCCGHGNIVIAILRRRLDGIYKKAFSSGFPDPALYAVANALNTIWAVDIDGVNVENCRSRVLSLILEFLEQKIGSAGLSAALQRKTEFFVHVLASIRWHIGENETLSAITTKERAAAISARTRSGYAWFVSHGHKPLDFEKTWSVFFASCKSAGLEPLEYARAAKFIKSAREGQSRGFDEFTFAKVCMPLLSKRKIAGRDSKTPELGM